MARLTVNTSLSFAPNGNFPVGCDGLAPVTVYKYTYGILIEAGNVNYL